MLSSYIRESVSLKNPIICPRSRLSFFSSFKYSVSLVEVGAKTGIPINKLSDLVHTYNTAPKVYAFTAYEYLLKNGIEIDSKTKEIVNFYNSEKQQVK